jgi:hypothetical protein
MTAGELDRITVQLSSVYGQDVTLGQDGVRRLIRIATFELYPDCRPANTAMLVVLDPGQPKPQVFVTPGQLLTNGRAPRSSSTILIGGESWMQFSFNIPWSDGDNIMRFLAAARKRFKLDD